MGQNLILGHASLHLHSCGIYFATAAHHLLQKEELQASPHLPSPKPTANWIHGCHATEISTRAVPSCFNQQLLSRRLEIRCELVRKSNWMKNGRDEGAENRNRSCWKLERNSPTQNFKLNFRSLYHLHSIRHSKTIPESVFRKSWKAVEGGEFQSNPPTCFRTDSAVSPKQWHNPLHRHFLQRSRLSLVCS